MKLAKSHRIALLVYSIVAFFGPNALYLYASITQPGVNSEAMQNPVALAFMIEAMMLMSLFLWYVFRRTRSWTEVLKYLLLSFIGSLAFSIPLFLYHDSRDTSVIKESI